MLLPELQLNNIMLSNRAANDRYAAFVAKYPGIIAASICVGSLIFFCIAIFFGVSVDFSDPQANVTNVPLKYAAMFIPVAASETAFHLWKNFVSKQLQFPYFEIVGVDFGIKDYSFSIYLVKDAMLIAFGGLIVMLCIWVNTGSVYLAFCTIMGVTFSTGISYFIYKFIYKIDFFPFMNLLVLILAIGVGVDDAFIFHKIWRGKTQIKESDSVAKILAETLKESMRSMFVTSLTTSVAFFATAISNITAMRCFGIFAGTTLLVNFVFMLSWFATNVVLGTHFEWFENKYLFRPMFVKLQMKFDVFFGQYLYTIIEKMRWISLIVCLGLTFGACFVLFVSPQMQFPRSKDFQLFHSAHLFERYDKVLKYKFDYIENPSITNDVYDYRLPLKFVWGVKAIDNGDIYNPQDMGSLTFDNSFNMSDRKSQMFLLQFCRRLRRQPFFLKSNGFTFLNCFIEAYVEKMKRKCLRFSSVNSTDLCCERNEFPYEPALFDYCLKEFLQDIYATPKYLYDPGVAGPKFDAKSLALRVLIVEFESTCSYSIAVSHIDQFFRKVEKWMKSQSPPPGMKNGWFVSDLEVYDLQRSLVSATFLSAVLSLFITCAIFFFCTCNLLLTCLAIVTILQIIIATMGILVLFQWELNIIESIAFTTTIGLSVDYCVHYAVYYHQVFMTNTRRNSMKLVITKMGEPSFMSAFTTIVTGIMMLCSIVLPYIKLGIFLIVITSVSWLYSTFFFGSALLMIGPEFGFSQINFKKLFWCKSKSESVTISPVVRYNRNEDVEICNLVAPTSPVVSANRPILPTSRSETILHHTDDPCLNVPLVMAQSSYKDLPATVCFEDKPKRATSFPDQTNSIMQEFHTEHLLWSRTDKKVQTTEL